MDRLTELEVFANVVELGGFTDAAKKLGISKSAASKHVTALENRLGARLLNRTTRRISPTEIGLAYFDKALAVIEAANEADEMATSMQEAPRGELKIAAPLSFGLKYVSPAVNTFLSEHPDVAARLHLDDHRVDILAEGFDLAIRIGDLPDSSMKARRLAETAMVLVAAPAYLKKNGSPENIAALNSLDLLHYTNLSSGTAWLLKTPAGEERAVRCGGRLSINNGDALADAAVEGHGVAFLPHFIVAEHLTSGALKIVLPECKQETIGIHAVYPAGRFPQPKLRRFIDHLAETLKGKGPLW